MIIISFRRTRTKFVKFMRCNPISQLCLHFYVILFGQNKYYLIRIVFSIVHRFSYYFMFVIMEATKLFHWVKAIYLSTIFYYDWSFLYLLITEGTYYFIQLIMNSYITIDYIIIWDYTFITGFYCWLPHFIIVLL